MTSSCCRSRRRPSCSPDAATDARQPPSTLYRWACSGLSGVRLEVVQVGGTMCTSRAAMERFFTRLAAARPPAKAGDDG
ncbi:MAG: DUF1580 domain-containing protein [Planctomycetota bacterium]|nr:MAG: DUF1580 domain-containing protein [Planctomycetota bacterium]